MSEQIVFHGGCIACTQQEIYSTEFCYNCQYFDAKWDKPDLSNAPRTKAELERMRIKAKMESTHNTGER